MNDLFKASIGMLRFIHLAENSSSDPRTHTFYSYPEILLSPIFFLYSNKIFFIELVFKAILKEAGINYNKEHNLYTLFNKMTKEMQRNIFKMTNIHFSAEKYRMKGFVKVLNAIGNNYVDFRYAFEKKESNTNYSFNFFCPSTE